MSILTRFKGKAFEVEGGWSWDVLVTMMGDNDDGFIIHANNIFSTKELAIEDMKAGIKLACDSLQEKIYGKSDWRVYRCEIKRNS